MTDNNDGSVIKPLPLEEKAMTGNIIEVAPLYNKQLLPLGTALRAVKDDYEDNVLSSAEYQTSFQRADTLRRASMRHSWTRATVMTVAKAAVGSGITIVRHPIYGNFDTSLSPELAKEDARRIKELQPVYNFFYGGTEVEDSYIQDLIPTSSKIMYTIASLVFYGQAAWEIRYDEEGVPIGFDVLPGFVFPNVNSKGKFKRPAYYFRPWNSDKTYKFSSSKKIFYITWPGTDMSIFGSSEYIAAAESSIPSDIYAAAVYRAHFENVNAPFNGFWQVSATTSDEDFKRFVSLVFNRYTGVKNFGKNPIIIRGDAEFKEMRSRSNDDAPYLEGRTYNQEEISALSGVSSSKLGLGSNVNRTNFREQRRDFWENTLRPIYSILEEAIYRQVFVRLFNLPGWHLVFNRPDLTTALEDATIYTRYVQNGLMNPNEARAKINLPPRGDDGGWEFFDPPTARPQEGFAENQSNPKSNRSEQDRKPEGNSTANQRPMTSERPQSDEQSPNKALMADELRAWKKFAIKSCEGKRNYRDFETDIFDQSVVNEINSIVKENLGDKEYIRGFFNELIEIIAE